MITLEEYKKWLIINHFKTETPEIVIACMAQVAEVPYKFLKLANTKAARRYIEQFMHTMPLDKNPRVSINRYLLLKYGYKYCTSCVSIKELKYFHSLSSRVDGKQSLCTDCRQLKDARRYSDNTEYHTELRKNRYSTNRAAEIAKVREWQNNNRGLVNAVAAKRRATKRNATPKWLTQSQIIEIKQLYVLARKLSIDNNTLYHVDHIVPLVSDTVCGLHVPWNLQILLASDNIRKSNKHNGIQQE